MMDIVNEFFRRHYPEDHTNREPAWCSSGVEQRYRGPGGTSATIFPYMMLADGLVLSVQGHFGAYSSPRGDFEDEYFSVEIMGPRNIPELTEWFSTDCGEEAIYAYVPVATVCQLIEKHGGLKA